MPDGSAAAPFNNNLYYFNDLRPRSPPPLLGDHVRARLRRATFGRAGSHVFRSMMTGYPRDDYISMFSDRISSEFFFEPRERATDIRLFYRMHKIKLSAAGEVNEGHRSFS